VVPRFLLVSSSIAAILGETTIKKRRKRLDIMTSGLGLDGIYDATLDRIMGQSGDKSALAIAALMWISCSERPMRIGELCDVLAVEASQTDMECDNIPSEKTLLTSHLGLVTVDTCSHNGKTTGDITERKKERKKKKRDKPDQIPAQNLFQSVMTIPYGNQKQQRQRERGIFVLIFFFLFLAYASPSTPPTKESAFDLPRC